MTAWCRCCSTAIFSPHCGPPRALSSPVTGCGIPTSPLSGRVVSPTESCETPGESQQQRVVLGTRMTAYILRRLLLIVPTMIGIMLVTFVVVQFAPGGPVERLIAQLTGTDVSATARFSGDSGDFG